jgi:hypothetical protein
MELLKSLWAKWKVHVSVVGGVLVIATAYGTCSVDPEAVSTSTTGPTDTVEVSATITTTPVETVASPETTTTTGATTATTTTE